MKNWKTPLEPLILKIHPINLSLGKGRQKDKCMFLLYVDANSVTNAKGKKASRKEEQKDGVKDKDFTDPELYAIAAIQSERNLFRLIVG